jgi:hypothetical protein
VSKSQLEDTKIRIKAIEFEKKNLFTSRKIYVMVTEPHDWEVRRRLSDFRWLSERLRMEFPQLNIRLFNGESLEDIEKYVNSLLSVPMLLKSRFLIFFLSCTNLMKFYQRREREFKQTVMKNLSKKLEGMMDTTSTKEDSK